MLRQILWFFQLKFSNSYIQCRVGYVNCLTFVFVRGLRRQQSSRLLIPPPQ